AGAGGLRGGEGVGKQSRMHPGVGRHCPYRPNTELVFPYGSARTALPWLSAPSPASCLFDRMLDLAGWGQFTVSKGAVSQYRNQGPTYIFAPPSLPSDVFTPKSDF